MARIGRNRDEGGAPTMQDRVRQAFAPQPAAPPTSAPAAARVDDLVTAVFVIAIGLGLGSVDLVTVQAPTGLRIPALIAALFLFGAGLNEVKPVRATKARTDAAVAEAEKQAGKSDSTLKPATPAPPADYPVPVQSPGIAVFLMGLAIWLGLAALNYSSSPLPLTALSMIAAFLIFYRGLGELPGQ